ncbi:hypothetical protein [Ralstonia phage phiRSL1]|uniref:Transmembrane protein n=1 Tax=Ralstonia phage phiRSL1 TaxID=1980924 RepID=B2ZXM4_9CAUD|nr:hypothetical protein RSL1_ORF005 [Ralstonia phage phiRSL1]BAG41450.1 hypothetical protein [Ralstonia phage phiRSL1]
MAPVHCRGPGLGVPEVDMNPHLMLVLQALVSSCVGLTFALVMAIVHDRGKLDVGTCLILTVFVSVVSTAALFSL